MMTKEWSTHIVNFMTPRAGVFALGCDHISKMVKMQYSFKNLFFTTRHRSDKLSTCI